MGAWAAAKPQLQYILDQGDHAFNLRYVGRPRRASPAEGSAAWHAINQAAIVEQAFAPMPTPVEQKVQERDVNPAEIKRLAPVDQKVTA
jgi:hypothetical protein